MNKEIVPKGEIKNAKITSVSLGYKDSPLTMWLYLEYGCGSQGFGGYCFTSYNKELNRTEGSAYGTEFIMAVLDVLGVDDIFKLKGISLRVDQCNTKVYGIGNYLKDKWFYPEELTERLRNE